MVNFHRQNTIKDLLNYRFIPNRPLNKLIQTLPHIAYKIIDLYSVIKYKNVLLEPYFPIEGFKVAVVEENGEIIEFYIQTDLSNEEVWNKPEFNPVS
ncbi:helicase [Francisella persica]|uniref:helicase n=1 Tax=Francisella persica TaxID=954 RepID=UPI000A81F262|nr:helicase [Francisella persica]